MPTPDRTNLSAETLAGIDIFRDLDASEREEIVEHLHGRRYAPNEVVVSHLDDSGNVFFIVSGTVRITVYSRSGKQVSFRDEGAGEVIGELSAIDGEPRSAHAIAVGDALILMMPLAAFREMMRRYPAVNDAILRRLTRLVRLLSERVVEFGTLPVPARVHAEMFRIACDAPHDGAETVIEAPPTHAEIAHRIGTHREAVTRELKTLEHAGLIAKRSGGGLVVPDLAALRRFVEDERQD